MRKILVLTLSLSMIISPVVFAADPKVEKKEIDWRKTMKNMAPTAAALAVVVGSGVFNFYKFVGSSEKSKEDLHGGLAAMSITGGCVVLGVGIGKFTNQALVYKDKTQESGETAKKEIDWQKTMKNIAPTVTAFVVAIGSTAFNNYQHGVRGSNKKLCDRLTVASIMGACVVFGIGIGKFANQALVYKDKPQVQDEVREKIS